MDATASAARRFVWLIARALCIAPPPSPTHPPTPPTVPLWPQYLNDVEEGGETVFPNIPAPGGDNGPEFSECARRHLAAKPKKGSAVLFHSVKPSGELERRSLHTAWCARCLRWGCSTAGAGRPARPQV